MGLKGTAKIPAKYRTADQWATLGVRVQRAAGDFPREERETGLSFIGIEKEVEVNTCHPDWMRRLEQDGAIPQSIQVYDQSDGEFRFYVIPRSWVKPPHKPSAARQQIGKKLAAKTNRAKK